jgi:dihydroorotate dehydrogenase
MLLRKELGQQFAVISVGGVVNGDDVLERLKLGADLVQGYTGFVYQGPLWARKINASLPS